MTAQPGKQTVAIQLLPNISISKSNQAMRCGKLIEYNIRNIFLKKSSKNYCGETNTRPSSEKSKLSISLCQ